MCIPGYYITVVNGKVLIYFLLESSDATQQKQQSGHSPREDPVQPGFWPSLMRILVKHLKGS